MLIKYNELIKRATNDTMLCNWMVDNETFFEIFDDDIDVDGCTQFSSSSLSK